LEFAATPAPNGSAVTLHLLQCRPQSALREETTLPVPIDLKPEDRLFIASRMVPQGQVSNIDYLIYVEPLHYGKISDNRRWEIAYAIGRLNKVLENKNFIMLGPGRWGSANLELGVPVGYADIYNSRALIELAVAQKGMTPEPSYGTHFFQDLVEAQIYPLAVYPGEPGDLLNQSFLDQAQNHLAQLLPNDPVCDDCLKVIRISTERPEHHLEISMDGERAVAYLTKAHVEERKPDEGPRIYFPRADNE
jgi:hypothetical protein